MKFGGFSFYLSYMNYTEYMSKLRKVIRRVLEENIDPSTIPSTILAYHGTPHGSFDKFDASKRGEGADIHGFGDYGNGFYFTPDKVAAENYARGLVANGRGNEPMVYTVRLKMNNPFKFDKIIEFDRGMNELARKHGNIMKTPDQEIQSLYDKLGTSQDEIDFIREVEDQMGDNWADYDIAGQLKDRGYDSLIDHDGNEFVVFDQDQIQIVNKEVVGPEDSNELDEAMVSPESLGQGIGLFISTDSRWKGSGNAYSMTLYDPKEDKVYGHIGVGRLESGNFQVGSVASEKGYGPMMYELAMSMVSPKGLLSSREGDTRSEAIEVWNKFLKRKDVRKEKVMKKDPDFSWETYEDLGNDPMARFTQTRYYYDGAKGALDRLKKVGDSYLASGLKLDDIDDKGNNYWLDRYD